MGKEYKNRSLQPDYQKTMTPNGQVWAILQTLHSGEVGSATVLQPDYQKTTANDSNFYPKTDIVRIEV